MGTGEQILKAKLRPLRLLQGAFAALRCCGNMGQPPARWGTSVEVGDSCPGLEISRRRQSSSQRGISTGHQGGLQCSKAGKRDQSCLWLRDHRSLISPETRAMADAILCSLGHVPRIHQGWLAGVLTSWYGFSVGAIPCWDTGRIQKVCKPCFAFSVPIHPSPPSGCTNLQHSLHRLASTM